MSSIDLAPKLTHLCLAAAVAGLPACTFPNGLFGSSSAMTSETATTTVGGTTEVEPSTSTTTSAGTDEATGETTRVDATTEGTAGETTTEATSTTSEDTASTTAGVDTEDTTNGGPSDCWGEDPTQWTIEPLDLAPFGEKPTSPRVSPDGLSLVFTAGPANLRKVYQVTRAADDQPFMGVQQLTAWPFGEIDHAMITNMGREMFVSGYNEEIYVSVHNGTWATPLVVPGLYSPVSERAANATEDGARILFERRDGPYNPYFDSPSYILYEAARAPYAQPGSGFSAPQPVALPGLTDDPNYGHLYYCATPSPDGLRLFFSSTYPNILPDNLADALRIFYTERESLDAPWGPPVKLESLASPGHESCSGSVTRDGCQLFFHAWVYPLGDVQTFVARR